MPRASTSARTNSSASTTTRPDGRDVVARAGMVVGATVVAGAVVVTAEIALGDGRRQGGARRGGRVGCVGDATEVGSRVVSPPLHDGQRHDGRRRRCPVGHALTFDLREPVALHLPPRLVGLRVRQYGEIDARSRRDPPVGEQVPADGRGPRWPRRERTRRRARSGSRIGSTARPAVARRRARHLRWTHATATSPGLSSASSCAGSSTTRRRRPGARPERLERRGDRRRARSRRRRTGASRRSRSGAYAPVGPTNCRRSPSVGPCAHRPAKPMSPWTTKSIASWPGVVAPPADRVAATHGRCPGAPLRRLEVERHS